MVHRLNHDNLTYLLSQQCFYLCYLPSESNLDINETVRHLYNGKCFSPLPLISNDSSQINAKSTHFNDLIFFCIIKRNQINVLLH